MLDRQKLEAILTRRFPGSTATQIAAAANAIMGLGEEWEEIAPEDPGSQLRILRRRSIDQSRTAGFPPVLRNSPHA